MQKRNKPCATRGAIFLAFCIAAGPLLADGLPERSNVRPLQEGEPFPPINLLTPTLERFDLNRALTRRLGIVFILEGAWSPYNIKTLKDLRNLDDSLLEMGFQIVAISPEPAYRLRQVVQQHALSFVLLSDSDARASRALRVAYRPDRETIERLKTAGVSVCSTENMEPAMPVPALFFLFGNGTVASVVCGGERLAELNPDDLRKMAERVAAKEAIRFFETTNKNNEKTTADRN